MTDERISSLRATAHPLRLRMLSLLTSSAMSAAEVARELDITHANASYHLRQLHDADLVVVEGEERIRGGMAKRYRYLLRPARVEVDRRGHRRARSQAMCSELLRRFPHRQHGKGTFTDAELWVAPETWEQAVEMLVEARCWCTGRRSRRTPPGTVPVNLTIAGFRMEAIMKRPGSRAAARPAVPVVLRLACRRPARRHHGRDRAGLRRARGQRLPQRSGHRARRPQHPDGRVPARRRRAGRPVRPDPDHPAQQRHRRRSPRWRSPPGAERDCRDLAARRTHRGQRRRGGGQPARTRRAAPPARTQGRAPAGQRAQRPAPQHLARRRARPSAGVLVVGVGAGLGDRDQRRDVPPLGSAAAPDQAARAAAARRRRQHPQGPAHRLDVLPSYDVALGHRARVQLRSTRSTAAASTPSGRRTRRAVRDRRPRLGADPLRQAPPDWC